MSLIRTTASSGSGAVHVLEAYIYHQYITIDTCIAGSKFTPFVIEAPCQEIFSLPGCSQFKNSFPHLRVIL